MQTSLIIGSTERRKAYIQDYLVKHHIQPYHALQIEGRIKIEDVRRLKTFLLHKPGEGVKRAIILPADFTLEAQHALLKTLEELPENTDVLIHTDTAEKLLPTVVSRARIVRMKEKDPGFYLGGYEEPIKKTISCAPTTQSVLSAVFVLMEELAVSGGKTKDFEIDKVIISLKNLIREEITRRETDSSHSLPPLLHLLKELIRIRPLLTQHNLNSRLALECVLLDSLLHSS